jgi:hypothetical protein
VPRYYDLTLINPATGNVATRTDGSLYQWTTNPASGFDPGALDIQFDIIVSSYDTPVGGYGVTLYGVALPDLFQAQNFMGDLPGKGYEFVLKGGFTQGLPLVNPAQAGTLARGIIVQSFGNWRGTEMSLDFVVNPSPFSPLNPGNLVLECLSGQTLSSALKQALFVAYPNYTLDIKISDQVKWSHDEIGFWPSLEAMAQTIMGITKGMLGDSYPGVSIWIANGVVSVSDGTSAGSVFQLDYTDFIGQPTWIDINQMQLFCNLRGDVSLGSVVKMPTGTQSSPGFVTTLGGSSPNGQNYGLTFQGNFIVTQVRHCGRLRDPSAEGWETVLTCRPYAGATS